MEDVYEQSPPIFYKNIEYHHDTTELLWQYEKQDSKKFCDHLINHFAVASRNGKNAKVNLKSITECSTAHFSVPLIEMEVKKSYWRGCCGSFPIPLPDGTEQGTYIIALNTANMYSPYFNKKQMTEMVTLHELRHVYQQLTGQSYMYLPEFLQSKMVPGWHMTSKVIWYFASKYFPKDLAIEYGRLWFLQELYNEVDALHEANYYYLENSNVSKNNHAGIRMEIAFAPFNSALGLIGSFIIDKYDINWHEFVEPLRSPLNQIEYGKFCQAKNLERGMLYTVLSQDIELKDGIVINHSLRDWQFELLTHNMRKTRSGLPTYRI